MGGFRLRNNRAVAGDDRSRKGPSVLNNTPQAGRPSAQKPCRFHHVLVLLVCVGVFLVIVLLATAPHSSRDLSVHTADGVVTTTSKAEEARTFSVSRTKSKEKVSHSKVVCRRPRTIQELKSCYPSEISIEEGCEEGHIRTWTDVQRCIIGPPRRKGLAFPPSEQQTIHILGERHSGTKFVTQVLQNCFPKRTTLRVRRDLLRSKHFFQPLQDLFTVQTSTVVVVVREAESWMAAMLEKPYHAPYHVQSFAEGKIEPLSWQEFVARPWTAPFASSSSSDIATANDSDVCQHYFSADEVRPCRKIENLTAPPWNIPFNRQRGFHPVYELNVHENGRPYDHLLQLRADKIRNFVLHVPLLLPHHSVVVVRYEDLLRNGTQHLLVDAVARAVGVAPVCTPPGPQPTRQRRQADPAFRRWMAQHIDLDTERLLGYEREWLVDSSG